MVIFCLSISNIFCESAIYESDIRVCAMMKTFLNEKFSSMFCQQEKAANTGIEIKIVSKYCNKLTQTNILI